MNQFIVIFNVAYIVLNHGYGVIMTIKQIMLVYLLCVSYAYNKSTRNNVSTIKVGS